MRAKQLVALMVGIALLCAVVTHAAAQNCGIIPTPQSVTYTTGFFTWDLLSFLMSLLRVWTGMQEIRL